MKVCAKGTKTLLSRIIKVRISKTHTFLKKERQNESVCQRHENVSKHTKAKLASLKLTRFLKKKRAPK